MLNLKPPRHTPTLRTAAGHCVICKWPNLGGFWQRISECPGCLPGIGTADKSASPVRELDELQGVYCCAPFFLRPLQRKHQLLGAGSAAARQNHPADGKGDPDDHPDWSEVYETEHKANKHCRSDDCARLSSQHEPSAALDRFSEFLNTNLKLLDLFHGRESGFKARSPL